MASAACCIAGEGGGPPWTCRGDDGGACEAVTFPERLALGGSLLNGVEDEAPSIELSYTPCSVLIDGNSYSE